MLLVNHEVTFVFGSTERTITVDYIQFGIELNGEVVEDIDYNLIEDYADARLLIKMKITALEIGDIWWLVYFLGYTSKKLIIDQAEFNVVNDIEKTDVELWGGYNARGELELKFRNKEITLLPLNAMIDDEGFPMLDDRGYLRLYEE